LDPIGNDDLTAIGNDDLTAMGNDDLNAMGNDDLDPINNHDLDPIGNDDLDPIGNDNLDLITYCDVIIVVDGVNSSHHQHTPGQPPIVFKASSTSPMTKQRKVLGMLKDAHSIPACNGKRLTKSDTTLEVTTHDLLA
jgi:hypothetical protein